MTQPLESSIVRIYSHKGKVIGAGFLVSRQHILTCAHVVAFALGIPADSSQIPAAEISLDFPRITPGKKLKAKAVFWLPVNPHQSQEDIAGLELISPLPDAARAERLVTSEDLWGHGFQALGFPEGRADGAWADGTLKGTVARDWVQLEAVGYALEDGFSGGPVWDKKLDGVVGMAVAADKKRTAVKAAFIIPTKVLIKAWSELEKRAIPPCPYRGLFAFREDDAKFFFGREKFTEQLLSAVKRQRLVAVIGASGSGKSSVVFAGLIPQLRSQQGWLIETFRPGDRPFYNLAAKLVPLLEPELSSVQQLEEIKHLAQLLQEGDLPLRDVLQRILAQKSDACLLLVVDQFEEIYTLCQDEKERKCFLQLLLEATSNIPNFPFHLVITLRADFWGYALSGSFAESFRDAALHLIPMKREQLKEVIEKPAKKQHVAIEAGLTELILQAVEQEPGNLPLLEFALTQLWNKQSNGKLTHAAYEEIGGVEQALANHAQAVYKKLNKTDKERAEYLFVQLVQPGAGTEDTRRLARSSEVGKENWYLVTRLANFEARLVVTGYDQTAGEETVEIVHEVLIRKWEKLREWIDRDRDFRTWQERLRVQMKQWEDAKKDDEALLRGSLLRLAKDWQKKCSRKLSKTEKRIYCP